MNRIGWFILIAVIALALVVGGFSLVRCIQGFDYGYWGMMGGSRMMGGWGFPFMGGIAMLLFWVLVIGGIVWLALAATRAGGQSAPAAVRESPLDILKRRYAAGEINKEQFEEMKSQLT